MEYLIKDVTLWAGQEVTPHRGWLHSRAGCIAAIGREGEAHPDCPDVLDGEGRHLLPSFVDCHTHVSTSAWMPLAGDASGWRSAEEALHGVQRAAKATSTDGWLLFMNLDYSAWPGGRYPTAEELEIASGGRRVLLVDITLHRSLVSESALAYCGLREGRQDPFGDVTRGQQGNPTGELWERAFTVALAHALRDLAADLGPEALAAMLDREAERHLSFGITDAHDPTVSISVQPCMTALNARSPLRVSWSVASDQGFLSRVEHDDVYDGFGAGPPCAKVFLDGAQRCAMCLDGATMLSLTFRALWNAIKKRSFDAFRALAATKSAYKRGHFHTNYLRFEERELDEKLHFLSNQGLRLKIHALGNLAAQHATEALIRLGRREGVTLEHLIFLTGAEIEALSRTGAVASIQPGFIPHYGPALLDQGAMRGIARVPARSLVEAGIPVSLSSDNPCGPLDPLHNVRCAVERLVADGRTLDGDEALAQSQALKAATLDGMLGITGASKRGLEVGAPADFIMCTGDPFRHDTQVERTWIDGHQVWEA